MEAFTSAILIMLIAVNLPTAIALILGLKLTPKTDCPEEVRDVRINKTALKAVAVFNTVAAFALILAHIVGG